MNKKNIEQLSAFMDGEFERISSNAINQLIADDEARKKWARYHLIGDSLRGQCAGSYQDIALQVSAKLDSQPQVGTPRIRRLIFTSPIKLAFAATVAACAVLGAWQLKQTVWNDALESTLIARQSVDTHFQQLDTLHDPDPRFNRYLASYSQHRAHTGIRGVPPHLRMAANWSAPEQ